MRCLNHPRKLHGDARSRHLPFLSILLLYLFLPGGTVSAESGTQDLTPPGNLTVSLVNGLNGTPIRYEAIQLKRLVSEVSYKFVQQKYTDQRGLTGFQINDFGSGAAYTLFAKPYNGGWVKGPTVRAAGSVKFQVGVLPVTLLSGGDRLRLQDHAVTIKEERADGSTGWSRSGFTDASGRIILDPPGVGSGRNYRLWAKSPRDGTWKKSGLISKRGWKSFVVGNRPLNVTLINGLTGEPLPGEKITALEQLTDGSYRWVMSHLTDAEGRAVFDLERLGAGRAYVLQATPYNGGKVRSRKLTATGDFRFEVGMLPVTLRDRSTGRVLSAKRVTLFEKSSDGKLHWRSAGITDAEGTVRFDAEGLDAGRTYLVRADDPYGVKGRYYGDWITAAGSQLVTIEEGISRKPDLIPPEVSVTSPKRGSRVAENGFALSGRALDNRKIDRVLVRVSDPVKGVTEYRARYSDAGYWDLQVEASALTSGKYAKITVEAYDTSFNRATVKVSHLVITDDIAPRLSIRSHRAVGDKVFANGFLVSGTAGDNTGVIRLTATVEDQSLGESVSGQPVELSDDGRWSLAVHAGEVSSDSDVGVTLTAYDAAGNQTSSAVVLHTLPVALDASRLIERITFGATPALLARVRRIGAERFLQEQLHPARIDDAALQSLLEERIAEMRSVYDLQAWQLLRATYSKRQLLEVMTLFWDNHFNTDIRKSAGVRGELAENEGFRENALGYFRDLLQVSATSPAMLRYLDNYNSHRVAPNENYARELMELHTLGVEGGYTQKDVEEVARVFTGWGFRDGSYYFSSWRHDTGEKEVLGYTLLPAGVAEGEQVLDILAEHPATARFICGKLLRLLVDDNPRPVAVTECASVFSDSGGHIGTVVEQILRSAAFNRTTPYHSKLKTPFEFYVGMLRNFQAVPGVKGLRNALPLLGMPLFRNPVPTGWPETGDAWSSTSQLLQRLKLSAGIAFREINDRYTYVELDPLLRSRGIRTAEGVVGTLFQLALGGDYSMLEWDSAIAVLTRGGSVPFDMDDEDAEERIRRLLALVMSFPSFQLQ